MPRKKITEDKIDSNELKDVTTVNNRFSDVIGKMEEETKKIKEKKHEEKGTTNKQGKNKKNIEQKYEINSKTSKSKTSKKEIVEEKKPKKNLKEKEQTEIKTLKKDIKTKNNTKEKTKDKQKNNEEEIADVKTKKASSKQLIKSDINSLINQKEELDLIRQEIKNQKKLPKNKMESIYSKILKNAIFAFIFSIYFCILCLDYTTIRPESFSIDIKVLSILSIITTVIIFEIAYKKDSGKLTIRGIEILLLAISNLLLIYIYSFFNQSFVIINLIFAVSFVIYYFIKTIVVYKKDKKYIKKKIIEEQKKEEV